jgi:hypothetical protein
MDCAHKSLYDDTRAGNREMRIDAAVTNRLPITAPRAILLDEYQSCSGEEMAIVYRHGETINDEARRDDDGAAIPCIVWKRAAVWRAVEPATVARRV